jgi:hypothetical protein
VAETTSARHRVLPVTHDQRCGRLGNDLEIHDRSEHRRSLLRQNRRRNTRMSIHPASPSLESVLGMRARVPQHVVHRQFAEETVVLNLKTGLYHGLNASGGRFMEVLDRAPSVGRAAELLAEEYGQPLPDIQRDVADFCLALAERELLALTGA